MSNDKKSPTENGLSIFTKTFEYAKNFKQDKAKNFKKIGDEKR